MRNGLQNELANLLRRHATMYGREVLAEDHVFVAPRGGAWHQCSNNANRLLYRLLDDAGIPRFDEACRKIDMHSLRHSFCTPLARGGASLEHARILMGHADVRLTSRTYTHIESEQTRAAIDCLPTIAAPKAAPAKLRLAE